MDLDFTVYTERLIPFIDGQGRGHRIVDKATPLVVPQSVRRRLASIADLGWLRIYASLDTCGRMFTYGMPPLEADQCFVVKYGLEWMKSCLVSSRLLVLDRVTAEVYYQGSAGDEG